MLYSINYKQQIASLPLLTDLQRLLLLKFIYGSFLVIVSYNMKIATFP